MKSLNELAREAHATAIVNGWYEVEVSLPDMVALTCSEACEALGHYRHRRDDLIPEELADIIIRVLDWCAYQGIDIELAIINKMATNRERPYRHGNLRC